MNRLCAFLLFLFFAPVSLAQAAIYVEKSGNGNPAIFLPGFTVPGEFWNDTIDHLESEFESHTVSYAGFNGNAPIALPWYNTIKAELIDYIRINQLHNLTLIGHSMGGMLAIDIAAELDADITSIVLVESLPDIRAVVMPNVPASALVIDSPYNKAMINTPDQQFQNMASASAAGMSLNSDYHERLTGWILQADRETYTYGYTELLKLDLRDKLAAIETDTLILGASVPDREMFQRTYENQYQQLTNKEIVIANNSMHFIMFDEPEWFYQELNAYLLRHE